MSLFKSSIHPVRTFIFICLLIIGIPGQVFAQSVWQKMKQNVLQQQCQQGIPKACQALAGLNEKQSQPNPQTTTPGQQPAQQGPHPPGRGSQQTSHDESGPIHPPNGTRVEETNLAPLANGAKFFVSPHGVHVATVESSGSRAVVYYDGTPGPKFDEILGGSLNSLGEASIAFSPDGKRFAYCGHLGSEMVVMVDGKEFLRSSESNMGRFDGTSCKLGFTSNSQHFYMFSDAVTSTMRGGSRTRFLFDGKEVPGSASSMSGGKQDLTNIAFSPDGNHYALIVTDPADESRWGLVVDGKMAPYRGGAPQWSPDSQHLYTTIEHPGPASSTEAMIDGKVFMRADHLTLYVAPAGNMVLALVDSAIRTPTPLQFLVVDGKKVPGTEIVHQRGATIDQITFSPDGRHYAVRFTTTQNHQYVFVDGKRAQEYQVVDHLLFTADSVKITYTASSNSKPYAVIGDQESETCLPEPSPPVLNTRGAMMVAPSGGRAGALCSLTGGPGTLYIDGKTLALPDGAQAGTDLRFSPDGNHYAYRASFQGGAQRLVVDGAVQMNTNLGTPSIPRFHYVFSPDSQHIAVDSVPPTATGEYASGIFLDGKYTPVLANSGMKVLQFTADSKHIAWAQNVPSREALRIFIDGKAVAEADTAVSPGSQEAWWEMTPDGSLLVLAQDANNLKRITITPSPETSLATLGGAGITVARSNK